jgi:uncharacterized protein YraI
LAGWSKKRYLAARQAVLNAVTGNDPHQPQGLSIRTGPAKVCNPIGIIPYQSRDVILHWCQPSPVDGTNWCRITYEDKSGWITAGYLVQQN